MSNRHVNCGSIVPVVLFAITLSNLMAAPPMVRPMPQPHFQPPALVQMRTSHDTRLKAARAPVLNSFSKVRTDHQALLKTKPKDEVVKSYAKQREEHRVKLAEVTKVENKKYFHELEHLRHEFKDKGDTESALAVAAEMELYADDAPINDIPTLQDDASSETEVKVGSAVQKLPPIEGKYTWTKDSSIEFCPGGKIQWIDGRKHWTQGEWVALPQGHTCQYKILWKTPHTDKHHHTSYESFVNMIKQFPDGSLQVTDDSKPTTEVWKAVKLALQDDVFVPKKSISIVGKWDWWRGNVVEIKEDGTAEWLSDGGLAKWVCLDKKAQRYKILWLKAMNWDVGVVSLDGNDIVCENQKGETFTAHRMKR